MKFNRLDYTVWAVLGALGLALALLLALGDRVGARVVGTTPSAGGTVGAYGRLRIEFAQAMVPESVTEHFSVEPPMDGSWRWEGQQGFFVPGTAYQPGTTYTARLRPGAEANSGRTVRDDLVWTFTVREPGVGYVSPAGGGPPEVWRSASGTPGMAVTQTNGRVYDFTISPDGERLVYSVVNDQGGIDLWLAANATPPRLLAECGFDRCTVPAFAPGGDQLAYSREEQGLSPGAPHGPPRVWLLNLNTGETSPLYQDSQVLGYGPTWSPDGQRIAFFDGSVSGIRVIDLPTRTDQVLPTFTGLVGAFSPDGASMFFTDLAILDNAARSHLYLADLNGRGFAERTGPPGSDFGPPAWSPDGQWLAIAVRPEGGGPGRQLWLMRPDGSEARALLADPAYTHGRYQWDPWSQRLLVQRLPLSVPFPKSEIVIVDLDGGEPTVVAVDATLPTWWP